LARERKERGVPHRVHQPQAEQRRGASRRDDRRLRRNVLSDERAGTLRADPVGLEERASPCRERGAVPVRDRGEANLHWPAAAAPPVAADIAAPATRGPSEDGPETVGWPFNLLEPRPPVPETLKLGGRQAADRLSELTSRRYPEREAHRHHQHRHQTPRFHPPLPPLGGVLTAGITSVMRKR